MADQTDALNQGLSKGINLLGKASSIADDRVKALALDNVNPLIKVKTLSDLQDERDALEESKREPLLISSLSGYILGLWEMARTNRSKGLNNEESYDTILINCERQRRGEYPPEKYAELSKHQGSTVYVPITSMKCIDAESWLKDTYNAADEKPWLIEPNPEPAVSDEYISMCEQEVSNWVKDMMDQLGRPPSPMEMEHFRYLMHDKLLNEERIRAQTASERMERKIETQLRVGNFQIAFEQFIYDLVTFPLACIKMETQMCEELKWEKQKDGKTVPVNQKVPKLQFRRISPWDLFFSPNCMDLNKGYVFERQKMNRMDLVRMKGVENYSDENIDKVLEEYGRGGFRKWVNLDWTKILMEGKAIMYTAADSSDITIDSLEFHGSVQGRLLKEWGIKEKEKLDDNSEYNITAILIGQYIIKAVMDDSIMSEKPYFISSYEKLPDTIYGKAIPQKMKCDQDSINANRRALINNLAISSGPQFIFDTNMLSSKEDISDIGPFRAWQVKHKDGLNGKPIDILTVPNYSDKLIQVEQFLAADVDAITSIPRYESGNSQVSGAAGTARGLSMLMSAATKTIRQVIKNVDDDIIVPLIDRVYKYNMLFDEDEFCKGDLRVRIRGTFNMGTREQRRQSAVEFLQSTMQNPQLSDVLGRKGIVTLLREIVKTLDLPDKMLLPTNDELEIRDAIDLEHQKQAAAAQSAQQNAQAQLFQQKVETEKAKAAASTQGGINNAVAQQIIEREEARAAMAQMSQAQQQGPSQGQQQAPPQQQMPPNAQEPQQ